MAGLLRLIASSDDFLLEESLQLAVAEASAALDGVDPEWLADDVTPEALALELRSPSLFSPTRVLVVPDIRDWLGAAAPAGAPEKKAIGELTPLLEALSEGLSDELALLLGAWCARKPRGELLKAFQAAGDFSWVPVPEPPKPWEDAVLSADQRSLLRGLLARAAAGVRFDREAEGLLLDRLGFAPRMLVSEATKLAAAAGDGGVVDEELVRRLVFPRERSLEAVEDAVLGRDATALLDLVGAAAGGLPVSDWRGQRVDQERVPPILFGQVANLLEGMLYLRRVASELDIVDEMEPSRTSDRGWYRGRFGAKLAPRLSERLAEEAPSVLTRKGKPPTQWRLSLLFRGAGRYRDDELVAALASSGGVEASLRGPLALEAMSAWLTRVIGGPPAG